MAAIPPTFGEGGTGLSPRGNGGIGIASVLRDIAADLATLAGDAPTAFPSLASPPAVTTGAPSALAAFTDPPSAPEMAALRAAFNTLNTRVTEIAARLATVATNLGDLAEVIEELHGLQDDRAGATLLTTAP